MTTTLSRLVAFLTASTCIAAHGSEILIFYRDGNQVVVRNCGSTPSVRKKADCESGVENRVPANVFEDALKTSFLLTNADKMKVLTPAERNAYAKTGTDVEGALRELKKSVKPRLDDVKKFIRGSGVPGTEDSVLFKQAAEEMTSAKAGRAAIQKLNDLIGAAAVKKAASDAVTVVSSSRKNDQTLYSLLRQFDGSRGECGDVSGASAGAAKIEARIQDCATRPYSTISSKPADGGNTVTWKLVARKKNAATGAYREIWEDTRTMKLWGDRLDGARAQNDVVDLNKQGAVVKEKICLSEDAKKADDGVEEKSFGIPTAQEFQEAKQDGMLQVLPNIRLWSISATPDPAYAGFAQAFNGYAGFAYDVNDDDDESIRCVGR